MESVSILNKICQPYEKLFRRTRYNIGKIETTKSDCGIKYFVILNRPHSEVIHVSFKEDRPLGTIAK